MEELIDLVASDGKASDISDKIKELLYAKAGEKINDAVPEITSSMFGDVEPEYDDSESGEIE